MDKRQTRLRRAKSTRARIKTLAVPRLTVHRSDQHIYAQVIDASGSKVIAAASTVQQAIKDGLKGTKNKAAAAPWARRSRRRRGPPASKPWPLIAPDSSITGALPRWPMPRARQA